MTVKQPTPGIHSVAVPFEKGLVYAIWTGIFLLLLMPLLVSTDTLFPFIVGKALHARAMILFVVGLWLVLAYAYPVFRPSRSWILLAFALYLGVSLISGLLGVSPQRSLWSTYERMQGVVDLAHWFLLAVVLTTIMRSRSNWTALLNLNLGVSLLIAFVGVAQHFGSSVPVYRFIEATTRIDATLGNPTYVGTFMMVNILIGLGLLSRSIVQQPPIFLVNVLTRWGYVQASAQVPAAAVASSARERRRRRRRMIIADERPDYPLILWRLFWIGVVLVDLVVLWWSGTRGAFAGLGIGLTGFAAAYLIWGRIRVIRRAALWLLAVLAVAGVLIVVARSTDLFDGVAESNIMVRQLSDIGLDNNSIKGRIESLSAGLAGFAERPVLGWGSENYAIAWARHFDAASGVRETFDQAHNKPVEELTTKGSFGFLSYMAIWGALFAVLARRVRATDSGQQIFLLFVGAALIGYFVQNLFLFDTPASTLQFVLLLSLVAGLEVGSREGAAQRAQSESQRSTAEEAEARPVWYTPFTARLKRAVPSQSGTVSPYVLTGMLTVVLVLVSAAIYFLNYRPYVAARDVVKTADASISWEERFGLFERSVGSFSPLANYPRLIMFGQLSGNWGTLSRPEGVELALKTVEREGERALAAEPKGWRIYVALAQVYQAAAMSDPSLLSQARAWVDGATNLAPETREVIFLRQRQRLVEEQIGNTESEEDE